MTKPYPAYQIARTKPHLPADLGTCYSEIVRLTQKLDDATNTLAEERAGFSDVVSSMKRLLSRRSYNHRANRMMRIGL